MPICIPQLKLNNFEEVTIPKPSELFARFGYTRKVGACSGDETIRTDLSKVEACAQVEKEAFEKD